jgi:membrane protease YdiL (CAAX protease family)
VSAPVHPERQWRAILALPVALAAVVAAAATYAIVGVIRAALTSPPDHHDGVVGVALHGPPPLLTFSSTLTQDVALVVGAIIVAGLATPGVAPRPEDFGLRSARLWSSLGLVLAGYGVFIALSAVWTSALDITDRENVPVQLGTYDSGLALAAAVLLVCVIAPVCEELFFRGYVFSALRRRGLFVAAGVTGLAFGLAHVVSSPIGFIVPLAALGVILCLLYERTRSLYPCMALHALNNSIAFGVADGRAWLIPVCLATAATVIYSMSVMVRRIA